MECREIKGTNKNEYNENHIFNGDDDNNSDDNTSRVADQLTTATGKHAS